ncbi:hypothetical protein TWF730_011142 [Orbilia blumenaviensis]|uniref:Uncharacterized protein n=1 Tax=Orbilia blumenaviensis TaxID=1796055 RepID=A0AAV9UMY3_9PEZI
MLHYQTPDGTSLSRLETQAKNSQELEGSKLTKPNNDAQQENLPFISNTLGSAQPLGEPSAQALVTRRARSRVGHMHWSKYILDTDGPIADTEQPDDSQYDRHGITNKAKTRDQGSRESARISLGIPGTRSKGRIPETTLSGKKRRATLPSDRAQSFSPPAYTSVQRRDEEIAIAGARASLDQAKSHDKPSMLLPTNTSFVADIEAASSGIFVDSRSQAFRAVPTGPTPGPAVVSNSQPGVESSGAGKTIGTQEVDSAEASSFDSFKSCFDQINSNSQGRIELLEAPVIASNSKAITIWPECFTTTSQPSSPIDEAYYSQPLTIPTPECPKNNEDEVHPQDERVESGNDPTEKDHPSPHLPPQPRINSPRSPASPIDDQPLVPDEGNIKEHRERENRNGNGRGLYYLIRRLQLQNYILYSRSRTKLLPRGAVASSNFQISSNEMSGNPMSSSGENSTGKSSDNSDGFEGTRFGRINKGDRSGGNSGKRQRDQSDDDDEEGGRGNNQKRKPDVSGSSNIYHLACPLAKGDPKTYGDCKLIHRKDLSGIKEHLKRMHRIYDPLPKNIRDSKSWGQIFRICNPDWDSETPVPSEFRSGESGNKPEKATKRTRIDPATTTLINGLAGESELPRNRPRRSETNINDNHVATLDLQSFLPSEDGAYIDITDFSSQPGAGPDEIYKLKPLVFSPSIGFTDSELKELLEFPYDQFTKGLERIGLELAGNSNVAAEPNATTIPSITKPQPSPQDINRAAIISPSLIPPPIPQAEASEGLEHSALGVAKGTTFINIENLQPKVTLPSYKYCLIVARRQIRSGPMESPTPKKFLFNSYDNFSVNFELWLHGNFTDPMFSWDTMEITGADYKADPDMRVRYSNPEDVAAEVEMWHVRTQTTSAAVYLVAKDKSKAIAF